MHFRADLGDTWADLERLGDKRIEVVEGSILYTLGENMFLDRVLLFEPS